VRPVIRVPFSGTQKDADARGASAFASREPSLKNEFAFPKPRSGDESLAALMLPLPSLTAARFNSRIDPVDEVRLTLYDF